MPAPKTAELFRNSLLFIVMGFELFNNLNRKLFEARA